MGRRIDVLKDEENPFVYGNPRDLHQIVAQCRARREHRFIGRYRLFEVLLTLTVLPIDCLSWWSYEHASVVAESACRFPYVLGYG